MRSLVDDQRAVGLVMNPCWVFLKNMSCKRRNPGCCPSHVLFPTDGELVRLAGRLAGQKPRQGMGEGRRVDSNCQVVEVLLIGLAELRLSGKRRGYFSVGNNNVFYF